MGEGRGCKVVGVGRVRGVSVVGVGRDGGDRVDRDKFSGCRSGGVGRGGRVGWLVGVGW